MNSYKAHDKSSKRWLRSVIISIMVVLVIIVGCAFALNRVYQSNLEPVDSSQRDITFVVESGATPQQIAADLEEAGLIKASWAFEWYIRNEDLREHLKAGTYELRSSMSVSDISNIITQGHVATDLVTILPGKRIDQVKKSLIETYGFDTKDVNNALNPANYTNHPALVDKPKRANLEGYLYPESFQKTADTEASTIIKSSLDEMQRYLTPELRKKIVAQGLTVHEGIILASIIEREVPTPADRKKVAQVFLRRLNEDIKLESDATASYGAVLDGKEPSPGYRSEYNTYIHPGLPPSPISNVSESSLQAVANPTSTNFLYFVSGDDGKTHFSFTLEEHEQNVQKYCTKLCR